MKNWWKIGGIERSWIENERNLIEMKRIRLKTKGSQWKGTEFNWNERNSIEVDQINGFDTVLKRFSYGFLPDAGKPKCHLGKNRIKTVSKPYQNR